MTKDYDAIVLGAGIGGLAAALLLAHSGKRVALFEKRPIPGGRLGSSKRGDFTVDYGVHLISRGEGSIMALPIVGEFLKSVYDNGTLGVSRFDKFERPASMPRYDCGWVKQAAEGEELFPEDDTVDEDELFFD